MPSETHMHAIAVAGGSGQRCWPLSRELNPEQLLSTFGTKSLIARAVHQILPLAHDGSDITVVTDERLVGEFCHRLTAQPDDQLHRVRYIQASSASNTVPAIALTGGAGLLGSFAAASEAEVDVESA